MPVATIVFAVLVAVAAMFALVVGVYAIGDSQLRARLLRQRSRGTFQAFIRKQEGR